MRIDRIKLTNFRCFEGSEAEPLCFDFAPGMNVIVGENGAGKTALLDALVVGLGAVYLGLPKGVKPGTGSTGSISKDDATRVVIETPGLAGRGWRYPVKVTCEGMLYGESITWTRTLKDRRGRTDRTDAKAISDLIELWSSDDRDGLPVVAYYGHGRLWQIRKNMPLSGDGDRLTAYERALEGSSDLKHLMRWWSRVELAAEQRAEGDGPLPEHQILVSALKRTLPDTASVRFDAVLDQPIVSFADGRVTLYEHLSAGYKNILGIVADLVYRCTHLNPMLGAEAAVETEGIVLIDEIDQHLHPRWQRQVLADLRAIFPGIQFIVTTHAPQVLVNAEPGEVRILERAPDGRVVLRPLDIPPGSRADEVLTGAWFGLPSTLDPDTLELLERHRRMLREEPEDPQRRELERRLRRRLGRFNDTSLEGLALAAVAELTAERPARTAAERAQIKAELIARLQREQS